MMLSPNHEVQLQMVNGGEDNTLKPSRMDLFDYKYENAHLAGSYQDRFHTKNRKITSDRVDNHLPDNSIQTSKYTWINFIPKQLFLQFSKLANLYFLIIGFMQMVPQVSISNSVPVIFMPLFVIILFSASKELYEDYKRQKSDQEENSRKALVLTAGRFQSTLWKDIRVGNIIIIEQDQAVPADIVVLKSSEAKGFCYVETKQLDGETNLKLKNVNPEFIKLYHDETCFMDKQKQIILKYETPRSYLYRFYGEVIDANGNNYAINFNNFLPRGCVLRTVKQIYGLVAYTGHDTKIMIKSLSARSKKSKVENIMQKQILYVFIIQLIVCGSCALYYTIWYYNNELSLEYLGINRNQVVDHNGAYNFFVRFANWILIFTNFVPISLLVTLEMVKLIQGVFIVYDKNLKQPTVQSSNLNEELGQIQHVFSDKTGTLTCNIMEFKQISIQSQNFGDCTEGDDNYLDDISLFKKVTNVDFRDKRLIDNLNQKNSLMHEETKECLFMIASCHTIVTDLKDGEIIYNASSPDELALLNFAKFCGVEYQGTDENNIIKITFQGEKYQFELLEVFEFTSSRKRQSCLIKILQTQEIMLYTKGADSVLLDTYRLNKESTYNTKEKMNQLNENLKEYGKIGLRTLVLAKRIVPVSEFLEWNKKYQLANKTLEGREEKLQILQDELEKNLEIIGATAIEDKLQTNVGQTIDALKTAGLKLWILTGDKIETAINIGYSSNLLNNETIQHIIDEKEEALLQQRLNETDLEIQEKLNEMHALIISGESLTHIQKPNISILVSQICDYCTVVLCCRVSPSQKEEVVKLVREKKPEISTLSIGDGANDVNMINAAHVGIGIRGVEGQQAARAADYAIAEFQELQRLLFYHGRESYRRNSNLVCYNFFKNVLLVLPQFWYGSLSSFSAQSLYDSFLYQLFNIFFASLPIVIYAVFDEEENPETLFQNKKNYYIQGIQNRLFNTKVFWFWIINALWQAAIICYFSSYINADNFITADGYTSHVWAHGTMVFGLVVLVSNFKILSMSNTFTIVSATGIIISLLSYLISWIVVDSIQQAEAYAVFSQQ